MGTVERIIELAAVIDVFRQDAVAVHKPLFWPLH